MTLVFSEILTNAWIYFSMTLGAFRKLHELSSRAINYFHRTFLIHMTDIIFTASKLEYSWFFKEILVST